MTSSNPIIKTWPIAGGIHPAEHKHLSNESPIATLGIAPYLILPLSQHSGAAAEPIVSIGDTVLKGQLIARPRGFISAAIHAPTSGTVIAIEPRPVAHPSGLEAECIVIESDQRDQWCERQPLSDYQQLERSLLLTRLQQAGIVGLGGAGFPAAVKLTANSNKPIHTLIINAAECEPYITADDRLIRERADQIISGIEILQYLVAPSQATLIGIEDNKPEAIAALEIAAAGKNIHIVSIETKYPSGGEKQLIQRLTGTEVPSGGLPADIGVVCHNIGTVAAIHRAIIHGEPLISRITTVTGLACQQQTNLEVLIGTPVTNLLAHCQFDAKRCHRLIMGGPMMGFTLTNTDVPVVKTTNCILAATSEELPSPPPEQACIRCGICAEACPASLLPQQLLWYSRSQETQKLESLNLMDCIECGACSYVCPSNIPLVQYYRASKAVIRQQKVDHAKAEQSKQRFEQRQLRLAREEQEKADKRAARQAAAAAKASAANGDEVDPVQAAIARAKAKKKAATTSQLPSSDSES